MREREIFKGEVMADMAGGWWTDHVIEKGIGRGTEIETEIGEVIEIGIEREIGIETEIETETEIGEVTLAEEEMAIIIEIGEATEDQTMIEIEV